MKTTLAMMPGTIEWLIVIVIIITPSILIATAKTAERQTKMYRVITTILLTAITTLLSGLLIVTTNQLASTNP